MIWGEVRLSPPPPLAFDIPCFFVLNGMTYEGQNLPLLPGKSHGTALFTNFQTVFSSGFANEEEKRAHHNALGTTDYIFIF